MEKCPGMGEANCQRELLDRLSTKIGWKQVIIVNGIYAAIIGIIIAIFVVISSSNVSTLATIVADNKDINRMQQNYMMETRERVRAVEANYDNIKDALATNNALLGQVAYKIGVKDPVPKP